MISRLNILKPWQKQDLGGKRPGKSVCVVRYGGFGDLIQASSVLPYFKENGWHVTFNTTPKGYNIVKHDPHIDDFFIQYDGQVPNPELGLYWEKLSQNFSRIVQFSQSIEKTLLVIEGTPEFELPHRERHKLLNVDYFHRMHEIADADLPPRAAFYPSKREQKWADGVRRSLGGGNYVVFWVLSGSSLHKAYPHMDSVIAELMISHPDARIVFTGDGLCQILEENWRKEKRVLRKSNLWSIRQALTFAKCADLVIGPETGILNSVAFDNKVSKIMMLSHSSPVNIGGSWLKTEVLTPHGCDCYPCHKLHYNWKTCNQDKATGGAACAAGISKDRVYEAILKAMAWRERKAA